MSIALQQLFIVTLALTMQCITGCASTKHMTAVSQCESSPWGEVSDGLQVRLTIDSPTGPANWPLRAKVEIRNVTARTIQLTQDPVPLAWVVTKEDLIRDAGVPSVHGDGAFFFAEPVDAKVLITRLHQSHDRQQREVHSLRPNDSIVFSVLVTSGLHGDLIEKPHFQGVSERFSVVRCTYMAIPGRYRLQYRYLELSSNVQEFRVLP